MESGFITTPNDTKYHYLRTGSETGSLLICLHGLGGSTETFKPLLPQIPSDFSIVLLDFPGFGKSPPAPNKPSIAQYVSDLHYLVTSLQGNTSPETGERKVSLQGSLRCETDKLP